MVTFSLRPVTRGEPSYSFFLSAVSADFFIDLARLRVNQFPNSGQMMIIVFGDEVQMIDEPHGLLQSGMEKGTAKELRLECFYACQ